MENQGFEGEQQQQQQQSQSSRHEFRPDGSTPIPDGHVYEDILPAVQGVSNLSNFHSPLHLADPISRDAVASSVFTRNLTLPFRRGVGHDSSVASCSVRASSRNSVDEDDDAFSTPPVPSNVSRNECRPVRRRKKKDCKHCRSKAASIDVREPRGEQVTDVETILRKNRDNQHKSVPVGSPTLRSPIKKVDDDSTVLTGSANLAASPASTFKFTPSETNHCRGSFVEDNGRTVAERKRADMRVNSIYSQDRWYAKEASIFFTDVKEHGSFQRAYSLPARTQTPSSQNRINLRRSVRGEPPPHPARLRKHRHGWTLHLAHPLEASGCTRSLVLLLIALLLLLGIGGVALYIAFEPEKLQIVQQYLRSSTNRSTSLLHRFNETTNASTIITTTTTTTTTTPTTTTSSTLRNVDRPFPESGTTLESEAETEAGNSTRYCDDCLAKEVCVALVDEQVPTCRLPLDSQDPTGCAGFCLINRQKCHRLDVDAFRCVEMEHYCLDDEWTCLNALCIPLKKHCDGHMNCYDHSDEYNCVCDLETHFQCGNETSCLPLEKRCDGKIDCWDAADEINCTLACPSENEFPCSNGQCILKARFCDGLPDCLDGSDEPHGCQGRCNKHEFTCQNGRCITKGMKCNGVDDCGDGTDERHCKDRFT